MIEHPVSVKRKTEHEYPYFENKSAAEAAITAIVDAQTLRAHSRRVTRHTLPGLTRLFPANSVKTEGTLWFRGKSHAGHRALRQPAFPTEHAAHAG